MAYQFNKNLETGNITIDGQHRELIQALNDLLEACSKGQGRDAIGKTSRFLLDYTRKHFADEEKLQQKYQYPDYPTHKTYHDGFVKVVSEIVAELDKTGPTIVLVGKINSAVGAWLIQHITREDVKLAAYIKSKA